MIKPLFTHLSIALAWLLFRQSTAPSEWIIGLAIGFLPLALYSLLISPLDYVRRLRALLLFTLYFIYAFVKANLSVALLILFVPVKKIGSSLFEYDISDLSRGEALFLSHLITLTPGTVTAKIDREGGKLTIHCLHRGEAKGVEEEITRFLKRSMVRFTR